MTLLYFTGEQHRLQDMLYMYSDPDKLERYVNDKVFQNVFWNNISYQTELRTPAMKNGIINPDVFMDTPINEDTGLGENDLETVPPLL